VTSLALLLLLSAADGGSPRLGVVVVIDQLGSADLETLELLGEPDFGGLEARGAARFDAWYDHLATETGPGHATLSTGASPWVHGICANDWFVGTTPTYCVSDDAAPELGAPKVGRSARFLEAPTLGDTLKARSPTSKVVSISVKDRAAILMGGPSADVALWYEPELGRFTTSKAYADALPAWASKLAAAPERAFENGVWSPLPGGAALKTVDARAGEASPEGFGPVFPHDLRSVKSKKQAKAYRATPDAVTDTFALAVAALDGEQLGKRGVPDLLWVSISTTDYAGHTWGPGSTEKVDLLQRTSQALRAFTQALDAKLGPDGWALVLSADHGAAPIPEQLTTLKIRAGRVKQGELQKAIRAELPPEFSTRVLGVAPPHVFLDERGLRPEELVRLRDGVARGLTHVEGVQSLSGLEDGVRRAKFEGRCGAVGFDLKPYFVFTEDQHTGGTDHASGNAYDRRVPLFVLGPGVVAGRDATPVNPSDAAPTLARLLGIAPPERAEGRPIVRAWRRP
jgi:hypothetical protein